MDDDVFLRDMYATKFSERGDTVATAGDSEEALRKASEDTYDVIIMDMVMPGMTGLDLLQTLKNVNVNGQVKYIILSNQGEDADIQKAREQGAVGYIIKADSIPSEVVEKVHALVQ